MKTTTYWIKAFFLFFIASVFTQKIYPRYDVGLIFEAGYFTATQGRSQHVNIEGLIGDDFSVTDYCDQNYLIGLGYYLDFMEIRRTRFQCGINAFYLAPTEVQGNVSQEGLATNLSYCYSIRNFPIYFETKALLACNNCNKLILNAGIGANIISAGNFKEYSLDRGIAIPDANLFSRKNRATFSATAGIGWKIVNIWQCFSLEITYRFFYLGEGELKRSNTQLINTIHTGNSYANALIFSISI